MSILRYGSVVLPYNFTTKFDQQAVYDESNTDRCYTRFEISAQGIINPAYLSVMAPDLVGNNLTVAEITRVITDRLRRQRQQLYFQVNGKELIPQPAGVTGTVDAMNGPQTTVTTLELSSETIFLSFQVVAHYWENYDVVPGDEPFAPNRPGNNALYNRWEERIELDELNFTKRTRTGKFKIRSDNVDGKIAAEVMSQMCVVGVPPGFLRKKAEYTVSPDGLSIMYTVTDEEQYKMPPSPAYTAEGHYMEATTRGDGKRFAEVRLRLQGTKLVAQHELVRTLVALMSKKLELVEAPLGDKNVVVQKASLQVDMFNNSVEGSVAVMFNPNKKRRSEIAFIRDKICITPLVDDVKLNPPAFSLRGSASRLLQAAAYYDPSLTETKLNSVTGQLSKGVEVGRGGKNP